MPAGTDGRTEGGAAQVIEEGNFGRGSTGTDHASERLSLGRQQESELKLHYIGGEPALLRNWIQNHGAISAVG